MSTFILNLADYRSGAGAISSDECTLSSTVDEIFSSSGIGFCLGNFANDLLRSL
jgi:hypothetical protein